MPEKGMAEKEASEKPKEQVKKLRGGWRRDGVSCSCWDYRRTSLVHICPCTHKVRKMALDPDALP